jgi:hypothetical protein
VITGEAVADTGNVVAVNVAVDAAAATVTLAGTVAAAVTELVSETTMPPAGALPVSVTVPVELTPPTTLAGATETEVRTAGFKVSVAVTGTERYVAVIVTLAVADTPTVVTVNVAVVALAATVTEEGTVAFVVSDEPRLTTAPPGGAFPFKVTVPVELTPPLTVAGASKTDVMAAGLTVSTAVFGTLA